ncbi:MAG: hypothetical protein ACQET8_17135 [Bacillota bacterium]
MIKHNKFQVSELEQEAINILKYQSCQLESIKKESQEITLNTDICIKESEKLLLNLGVNIEKNIIKTSTTHNSLKSRNGIQVRTWKEIINEVDSQNEKASFSDILSNEEIQIAENKIKLLRGDFYSIHSLDKIDWTICGVAGILASLVDIFLVQMPNHPDFLGTKGHDGGPLSNFIRQKIKNHFSLAEIRELENNNWVPYDPAHSKNLGEKVAGLSARTHRFQSLGHDPLLGFLFGTKDIISGTFSAVDKHGKLIMQSVNTNGRDTMGMNLFESIARVFGHMKSDISTASGLPVPLMPLFQFLQFGSIGNSGFTIGEVSRIMFRQGYNFSHFLSMSVSTVLIEVIVRVCYMAKSLYEGNSIRNSVPFNGPGSRRPKLQTMLFSAHLIATAANAGKVAVVRNPLAVNYSQWIAFFKYTFQQLKWSALEKDKEIFRYVQKEINDEWDNIDKMLEHSWKEIIGKPVILD